MFITDETKKKKKPIAVCYQENNVSIGPDKFPCTIFKGET